VPATPRYHRNLLEAAIGLRPAAELDRIATETTTTQVASGEDPETSYEQGSIVAFAGKDEAAIHMIRMAIEGNYCAYSALKLISDQLIAKLRSAPGCTDLLKAARLCQEPVLAQRNSNAN
jgi:hypothetical protein